MNAKLILVETTYELPIHQECGKPMGKDLPVMSGYEAYKVNCGGKILYIIPVHTGFAVGDSCFILEM